MTASAWLAVGATVASLLGPGLRAETLVMLATAFAVAAAAIGRQPTRWRTRLVTTALPASVGALAIAVRLATASVAPAAVVVPPPGAGPWSGAVETVSPPRDGQQVATLRLFANDGDAAGTPSSASLGGPQPGVAVAATLPRFPSVGPGDIVRVDGRIEPPPGTPYGDYLRRIGVDGTIRSRSLSVVGRTDDLQTRLQGLRRGAGTALAAAIPEPEAGLAAGIVIGLRDRVDRDLAADFTTVGASHVVAISGWNIAIVAATVSALLGGLGRRRRAIVLVVAVIAYVVFAGASASVIRAAVMAGVVLVARETGRAGRATAALGWAAALLLLADPALVTDAGFQLSTLATGGILAWASPWTDRIQRVRGHRVPHWLAESLGVSLAAQAATLPVVLLTFGRLAIVSPVVNLAIVPLVAPAMAAALVALVGGLIALAGGPSLAAVLAGLPAWGLLTTMCAVIRAAAELPFASVSLGPPWTLVAGGAAALGILAAPVVWRVVQPLRTDRPVRGRTARPSAAIPAHRMTRTRASPWQRVSIVALAAGTAALALAFAHRSDGTTRITVLDVGQGDSILVEGGRGGRMLVDGGPDPDRLLVELDRRLPPWDRRIDILVLTHPHEDHVAGMPLLLERYRIGRVFESGMRGPGPGYAAFARELAGSTAPRRATLATGATILVDDVRLRVLWPDPGGVPREPPDAGRGINDVSVVFLGEVAGRRFLLTGDVEDDVDPRIADRELPPVDILKVAHHGSATASTPAFLDRVRPKVAVVSAGAGNPYGHPARSTIDRLRATGADVLRTDTDGSVAISISPSGAIGVATTGSRSARLGREALAELTLARDVLATAISSDLDDAAAELPRTKVTTAASRELGRGPRIAFACGIPSNG